MATALATTFERERTERWIETLERHLEKARTKLNGLLPEEPQEPNAVIRFRKYNSTYTFAALKISDRWYITQDGSRSARQGHAPKTWDELLTWIGTRNWDSIEVLA